MSEATPPPSAGATDEQAGRARGLLYAIYNALAVDLGCLIGAAGFVLLIVLSVVFASQITPCTSAGGIPCAH